MRTRGEMEGRNAGLSVPLRTELLIRLSRNQEEVWVDGVLVNQVDQFLVRLRTVLRTSRGIVNQPLDCLVG
jgi:hypothetical protein